MPFISNLECQNGVEIPGAHTWLTILRLTREGFSETTRVYFTDTPLSSTQARSTLIHLDTLYPNSNRGEIILWPMDSAGKNNISVILSRSYESMIFDGKSRIVSTTSSGIEFENTDHKGYRLVILPDPFVTWKKVDPKEAVLPDDYDLHYFLQSDYSNFYLRLVYSAINIPSFPSACAHHIHLDQKCAAVRRSLPFV